MDPGAWIGLGALFVSGLVYAVSASVWVSSKDATLREKIAGVELRCSEKIDAASEMARLKIEAASEKESKARHDLANAVTGKFNEVRLDQKAVDDRVANLSADMVRKGDLAAHEARMTAVLEKLDGKIDELRDRITHA